MASRPVKASDSSENDSETTGSNRVSFIQVAAPVVTGNRGPQRPAVQKAYDEQAFNAFSTYLEGDDATGWVRVGYKSEEEKRKIKLRFNSSYRWLRETKGLSVSRQNGSGVLDDGTKFLACRFIPKTEEDF